MEYSQDTVTEGYELLTHHIQGAGLTPALLISPTLEDLKAWLTLAVQELLDRQLDTLLQICYRIDLGEDKVKEILSVSPPGQVAADLANAMLDRELQKVYFRQKYRTN